MAGDFDRTAIATLRTAAGLDAAVKPSCALRPQHGCAAVAALGGADVDAAACAQRAVCVGKISVLALPAAAHANAPASDATGGTQTGAGQRQVGRGEGDVATALAVGRGCARYPGAGAGFDADGAAYACPAVSVQCGGGGLQHALTGLDADVAAAHRVVAGSAGIPAAGVHQVLGVDADVGCRDAAGLHQHLAGFDVDAARCAACAAGRQAAGVVDQCAAGGDGVGLNQAAVVDGAAGQVPCRFGAEVNQAARSFDGAAVFDQSVKGALGDLQLDRAT